ncbi:MAG: helix-turn-helix domain-containing protein [Nitrospirota bacterium]
MRSEPRGIVERLLAALGVKTQAQLATKLEIRPQSVISAITRGEIPEAWLYRVAYLTGRSVEWLRTGKGEVWREGVIAEVPPRAYGGKGESAALRRILEAWEELDADAQATVERCVQALRLGDREIRDHLTAQMKLIEETVQRRRAKRGRRRR